MITIFRVKRMFLRMRLLLPLAVFCLLSGTLAAQTAQRVENMLGEKAVNWSTAADFVLEAAGLPVFSASSEAFEYAQERNWLPKGVQSDEPVNYGGLSLFFMQAFGFKGGIFYTIAKNPHYAYREMVYREVLQGRTDPKMHVSGPNFLFVLGRVLSLINDTPVSTDIIFR